MEYDAYWYIVYRLAHTCQLPSLLGLPRTSYVKAVFCNAITGDCVAGVFTFYANDRLLWPSVLQPILDEVWEHSASDRTQTYPDPDIYSHEPTARVLHVEHCSPDIGLAPVAAYAGTTPSMTPNVGILVTYLFVNSPH